MKDIKTITYAPGGPVMEGRKGAFLTSRLMFAELVSARELVWRLFVRDFSAKYRQTALGVIWAVLMPLFTVGIFIGMNRAGVLSVEDVGIPYPLYAIIGLSVWNVFSVGLVACTGSLVQAGAMVAKINFPKVTLVLAASGQSIVEFIIRMGLIAAAFAYFGVAPDWAGLFIGLLMVVPIYLLMTGIGFVLSLVAGVMRDVLNAINILLMGAMLLTPILYPIQGEGFLAKANRFNPLNYLVNVPRDFMVTGRTENLEGFLWSAVFSFVVFYLGWRLFYLAQTKIAERI